MVALLLALGTQYAPGLLADVGRVPVLSGLPDAAVYARMTTLFLIGVALFLARSMHGLTAVILWGALIGISLRLGEVRMTGEPLTVAFAAVLLAVSLIAVRVILRPNETDTIAEQRRRIEQLEGQLQRYGIQPPRRTPMITAELLRQLNPKLTAQQADTAAHALQQAAVRFDITTPLRLAHFLAQLGHESGFLPQGENLNYSASGLANTWPHRYSNGKRDARGRWLPNSLALQLHRKPQAIADHCYANRMGNGSPASGDGWRYRGRPHPADGPSQLRRNRRPPRHQPGTGTGPTAAADLLRYGRW
ncbi:hypothetical protein [Deinococcus radiophilus]|uniref:hypothetical protein n=1 Tax=Deinococcus radiophilus TaxID=32062 RepID=UPI003610B73F